MLRFAAKLGIATLMVRKEAKGLIVTMEGAYGDYWIPNGEWNPESRGSIEGNVMTDEPSIQPQDCEEQTIGEISQIVCASTGG